MLDTIPILWMYVCMYVCMFTEAIVLYFLQKVIENCKKKE